MRRKNIYFSVPLDLNVVQKIQNSHAKGIVNTFDKRHVIVNAFFYDKCSIPLFLLFCQQRLYIPVPLVRAEQVFLPLVGNYR
jgi:hypothetical protein